MAGDGRAKRLKTSLDGAGVATAAEPLRGGTAQTPRSRPATSGNNHEQGAPPIELLPVAATPTVDLSRVGKDIVTHITSFLGESGELLNLALTCKSFGWRQPTSARNLSLVEEVACQAVCSRATDAEMSCLPRHVSGTTTWLSILHRFEHLLLFDVLLGRHIEHQNGDKTTVQGTNNWKCSAVSSHYVMRSGTHYAEFQVTGQPSDEWSACNVHACQYNCGDGGMEWTDWNDEYDYYYVLWEGMEECGTGDTVGMLLDLGEGTLTVYKNSRRLGVMKDGLAGSYCWCVTVRAYAEREAVAIRRAAVPAALNE
ncbi:hypothetical protein THAOC_12242 [Thalassiosira oceanica]|uniref:B30.2/SPRY domain-containing protein n=1 Tax=Thalassiosira oceanica TaxID=159749 RepID=K0SP87_THAOC|nr:hypothetical protein THAOC_12242 [Thalassiosira oceanica]|eukprot:EJK66799.1 hypothetical protein THAOC_12242 [Thalassiosira oceanica]